MPPKHDAGPQPDIIEHFGNADAVPQLPERCLSRKAGIMRCCPEKKLRAYIFKLAVVQIGVEPASGQQVVVGALLHNVTIPHD